MKDIVAQPSEDNQFTFLASSGDGKAQVSLVFGISLSDFVYGALSQDSRFDDFAADPPTHTFLLVGVVQPFSATAPAPSVPEPSTWALMIVGFAGVGFLAIRRRWNSDRCDNHIGRAARAQRGWLTREIFAPALRKTEFVLGFSCMTVKAVSGG